MTDPKLDNWRTRPAFNHEFTDFTDCVSLAVLEFSRHPSAIFLILKHNRKAIWLVMPWSQYRSAPAEHACHNSTVIFRGNLFDLRKIAYSFPPDLFTNLLKLKAEPEPAEPDSDNEKHPAQAEDTGNGSDSTEDKEPDA